MIHAQQPHYPGVWPLPPNYNVPAPGYTYPRPPSGYNFMQPMQIRHQMHGGVAAAPSVPADHFPTVEDELEYLDNKYTGKAFRNYKRFIDVITSAERMDFYYIDGFVRYIRQRTLPSSSTAQTLIKVLKEADETISLGMATILINHFENKFDTIENSSNSIEFDY